MGYYSDACLRLTAAGKLARNACTRVWGDVALTEAEKNSSDFADIKNMLDSAEVHTDADSGTVAYLWENTKWYDDLPEVRFIENLLRKLGGADFLLIRVGEDCDDTELQGDFWNNPLEMRLTRGIACS